jgi:hypothetical protein
VVFEQRPPFYMDSPHLFRFSLHSILDDHPYVGTEFVFDNDSSTLIGCEFKWGSDRVEVITSQNQHFVGKLGKGGQTWERVD